MYDNTRAFLIYSATKQGNVTSVCQLQSKIFKYSLTPYDLANRNGHKEVGDFLSFSLPENAEQIVTAITNGNLERLKQLLQEIG